MSELTKETKEKLVYYLITSAAWRTAGTDIVNDYAVFRFWKKDLERVSKEIVERL